MKYGLKLGLEVHAQLRAPHKLFSLSRPQFSAPPNSQISFFDAALPGTQPKLSWDCVRLAVRAGLAVEAEIPHQFSFDRKHYMYPDQPSGYQITQFREPIAKNGFIDLLARDLPAEFLKANQLKLEPFSKQVVERIRIQQIQMEQDTGKTSYIDDRSLVDLNRANTALIELVTMPDFTSEHTAVAFVRKLQQLLRRIDVCTGDMETGAMRIDVNVSLVDFVTKKDLTERCEIKNLFSTSAVKHAVRHEFARQVRELETKNPVKKHTRGWDGRRTFRLRDKESALDYRYMPDPDIPRFTLSTKVVDRVRQGLPSLPDTQLDAVLGTGASLADAKTLLDVEGGVDFVLNVCENLKSLDLPSANRLVSQWLVNRWLGVSTVLPNAVQFTDLMAAISLKQISSTTGKLVLKHMAQGYDGKVGDLVREYDLVSETSESSDLREVCLDVIKTHMDVVKKVKSGKKNSLGFLLGQVMKETQGKYAPPAISRLLTELVKSTEVSGGRL